MVMIFPTLLKSSSKCINGLVLFACTGGGGGGRGGGRPSHTLIELKVYNFVVMGT